jgi:hypothetical protein
VSEGTFPTGAGGHLETSSAPALHGVNAGPLLGDSRVIVQPRPQPATHSSPDPRHPPTGDNVDKPDLASVDVESAQPHQSPQAVAALSFKFEIEYAISLRSTMLRRAWEKWHMARNRLGADKRPPITRSLKLKLWIARRLDRVSLGLVRSACAYLEQEVEQ